MMKLLLNRILRIFGIQLNSYPGIDLARRFQLLKLLKIDLVFDVGANNGGFAVQMRDLGYNKTIVSFEPINSVFKILLKKSSNDPRWIVNNYALGEEEIETEINISNNSFSSSILMMLPLHLKSAPNSNYISKETIKVKKFDQIFGDYFNESSNVYLKIDTQGYEKLVLNGALNSLNKIKAVQLEMSLFELYKNECLFVEMIGFMETLGFELFSLENGHSDPETGQLLQVDGLFINRLNKNELN